MKLTCGCLNICIYTKNETLNPVNILQLGADPELSKEEFFQQEVSEVHLDTQGITVEHGFLVQSTPCQNWRLHMCMNCLMWTHAVCTSDGQTRVLVNYHVKKDPTSIERLLTSPDYSALYNVVIHTRSSDQPIRTQGIQSGRYESLQQTLNVIQTKLSQCLGTEEAAMEERIRLYEQEQRANFAELQTKARRDKNAMISLVLANAEQFDAVGDIPTNLQSPTFSEIDNQQSSPIRLGLERTSINNPIKNENQQTHARNKPKPDNRNRAQPLDNDYALFDLDGFGDDPNQPFYHSEDEEDDTSEGSSHEEISPTNPHHMYSTSVPVTVPTWSRRMSEKDVNDVREPAPDPEHMAASIKALAQSVHNDGTSIFGDLPRKRINTFESGRRF